MNAILSPPPGAACARAWVAAGAAAQNPIHAHTVTTRLINDLPKRKKLPVPAPRPRAGPRSEEVAQLEVQLEGRCGSSEGVGAVEAVRPVDADGAERRDDAQADTGAPEQAGRIELAGGRPHVAGVEETVHAEQLRQPRAPPTPPPEGRLPERGARRPGPGGGPVGTPP